MKVLSAILVGLLSGFMIYMLVAMVIIGAESSSDADTYNFYLSFLGGWIVSSYGVSRGADSASRVWARGALIGAIEWMIVGFIAVVYGGATLTETTKGVTPSSEIVGAGLVAGLFLKMGLWVAVFMALVCLIVYFITKLSGEEFHTNSVWRSCQECAEMIAIGAKKCRFCGAPIDITI